MHIEFVELKLAIDASEAMDAEWNYTMDVFMDFCNKLPYYQSYWDLRLNGVTIKLQQRKSKKH